MSIGLLAGLVHQSTMHFVKPSVKLLYAPVNGLERAYLAARRCYFGGDARELVDEVKKASREEQAKLVRSCIKSGHESILEHVTFTFHMTLSRAASHQIVRHRLATYSQMSQRYCKIDDLGVVAPREDCVDNFGFMLVINILEKMYKRLINKRGWAAEDARALLPNCGFTHMVVTMNVRQLRHFFEERCCNRAQKEIRGLANSLLAQMREYEPELFENAGPKCLKLGRCPEAKPCGCNPWKKA